MRYLQNEHHKPLTPPTPAGGTDLSLLNRRSVDVKPRQLPALPGTAADSARPATRNGALLGQCSSEMLIEMLKQHAGLKDCSAETVQHINAVSVASILKIINFISLSLSLCYCFQILLELYTRVHKQERNFKRAFILGGLYGLVECTSPRILLAVARVVLAVS